MDEELLAQILAAQSPQLSPLALAATQGGVSRTTLGQLTDPNILLGTGVARPADISSGLRQYLTSQLSAAQRKAQEDFNTAMEKYAAEQRVLQGRVDAARQREPVLYSDVYSRYQNASPIVRDLFDDILTSSGPDAQPLTAAQVTQRMAVELTADDWVNRYGVDPATAQSWENAGVNNINTYLSKVEQLDPTQITDLKSGLRQFEDDASSFRERQMEFADTFAREIRGVQEDLERLGPPPSESQFATDFDREAERLEYYKDIGLPGLALLPDPGAQYNVAAADILSATRAARPSGMTATEELYRRQLGRRAPELSGAPEPTLVPTRPSAAAGGPAPSAAPSRVPSREVAGQRFVSPSAPAPAARRPSYWDMDESERLQWALEAERRRAGIQAEARQRALTSAGRTPFEDAMRQLYQYGVAEARA